MDFNKTKLRGSGYFGSDATYIRHMHEAFPGVEKNSWTRILTLLGFHAWTEAQVVISAEEIEGEVEEVCARIRQRSRDDFTGKE